MMLNPISAYISKFPAPTRAKLKEFHAIVKKAAPKAEQLIRWGMPTFKGNKNLVHFAGHKNHIGFYPTPSAIRKFQKELGKFTFSKGAVQFPLEKKLPAALITKMVKFRVKEDLQNKRSL